MRIVADKSFHWYFFFRGPSLQIQPRASQKQRRSRKAQMHALQTRIQLSQQLAFAHAHSHSRKTVPVQVLQEVVFPVFNSSESHQASHGRKALQVSCVSLRLLTAGWTAGSSEIGETSSFTRSRESSSTELEKSS